MQKSTDWNVLHFYDKNSQNKTKKESKGSFLNMIKGI